MPSRHVVFSPWPSSAVASEVMSDVTLDVVASDVTSEVTDLLVGASVVCSDIVVFMEFRQEYADKVNKVMLVPVVSPESDRDTPLAFVSGLHYM